VHVAAVGPSTLAETVLHCRIDHIPAPAVGAVADNPAAAAAVVRAVPLGVWVVVEALLGEDADLEADPELDLGVCLGEGHAHPAGLEDIDQGPECVFGAAPGGAHPAEE